MKKKKITPRHIIIKLLNARDKNKHLKATREIEAHYIQKNNDIANSEILTNQKKKMNASTQWTNIFKESITQTNKTRMLYLAKMPSKMKVH